MDSIKSAPGSSHLGDERDKIIEEIVTTINSKLARAYEHMAQGEKLSDQPILNELDSLSYRLFMLDEYPESGDDVSRD